MKGFVRTYKRQLIWIAFGLVTLGLHSFLRAYPEFVESVYTHGLFVVFRMLWDHSIALVPIPLLYVLILGLLGWGIWQVRRRLQRKESWLKAWKKHVMNVIAFSLGVIAIFFWLWGFNYNRIPLTSHLQLEAVAPDKAFLKAEVEALVKKLDSIRSQIPQADSNAIQAFQLPEDLEIQIRKTLENQLDQMGYPTVGRVRVRKIFPKGWLRGMGATGIYIPFVGEGHFDASLHPVQHPAVMAHEMSHGYAFTNEGVCNFLALVACEQSGDPAIQYSGLLMYFRYAVHDLFRMDPASYRSILPNLPVGIQADLEAIKQNRKQYPGWFPDFSRKVYNKYLQSQGVEGGLQSYNQVVGLYLAWQKQRKSNT